LIRLIGMSGSLRSGSYSNAVLDTLREKFDGRAEISIYDLRPIPLYDQDFNHSIPGVLKNALDWASRPAFTSVMAYKPVAIMATSRGALGGARCLEHLRVALDSMLSRVALAREVIITSSADKIRDGRLVDETSLGFACGAVEALLHEIRLWRTAEHQKG
jgi:chromate reductase, NAD(P)H dehydrogenase (quinone)